MTTQRSERRYGFIDSLRLLAAMFVVFQHLFEHRDGFAGTYIAPLGPGVAGVALFFFISGYVIPLSVKGEFSFASFLIRRIFRIYPLFLITLGALVVLGAGGLLPHWAGMIHAGALTWLANLLLVQDFVGAPAFLGVSWTLAIEMIWYMMFGIGILVFRDKAADRLQVLMSVSLVALAVASLGIGHRIPLGRPTMIYAAIVGYQCLRYHLRTISGRRLTISILTFLVVALATNYVAFGIYRHPHITLAQAFGPWALSTAIFLGVALIPALRNAPILNCRWLPALGAMSYSTYLLHPIAISAAELYATAPFRAGVALALTLILSILGYFGVERPGIRIGRLLTTKPKRCI